MAKTRRTVIVGMVLGLFLGALPGPVAAGAPQKTRFEASDCTEAMAFFLLDPAELQALLPQGFTVLPVLPGRGELLVMISSCESSTIDGRSTGGVIFSEVGIYIETPEQASQIGSGAPGFQYYQLWHLTDLGALRKKLARLGVKGAVVADAVFEGSAGQAEGDMQWSKEAYAIDTMAPVPDSLFRSRDSTFWHLGKKGLVATTYRVEAPMLTSGRTELTTAVGGVLAKLVGGGSATAHQGVIGTYAKLTSESMRLR